MITMLILRKNQAFTELNGYINPLVALLQLRLKTLCASLKLGLSNINVIVQERLEKKNI